MLTKQNELKVIDFDGALRADSVLNPDELAKGIVAFMSNMRLGGGRPPQVVASRKMDIWSLGVTICEVFSGKIVKPIWKSSRYMPYCRGAGILRWKS
ncbi:hypothetical protein Pmar_PMAR011864 [Perkinsus marinus ATCC 50983]|uniref:Protein kinase domain-containing protein n=1 Tax=Perkinsus marinus (strain ATCC 50983 / TXsc) TaxID=423536 RepID=C5LBJ3_PERM5|nr:hypothetical protein Pmar_PMAR011864 [Perkinsus marinus ATCC 50983]EER05814.1 hypothetical protein Pmar_PMAR011864 [Perkinsus marinus ATCC 50983]|eukprot:XP_002773998.1 hypothetical protein Pmar_PMAR011864 [Perkinsus marinus ATCC 50983]